MFKSPRQVLALLSVLVAGVASVATSAPPWEPEPARDPDFLMRDGIGSIEEAEDYYRKIGFEPEIYELRDFRNEFFGSRPVVKSVFFNEAELGFLREMQCTEVLGRGEGACMVSNYNSEWALQNGVSDGTVAMRVDEAGRTQFLAFDGDDRLTTLVRLDSEGLKAVPFVCTNCHGGNYDSSSGDTGMGALFREFEPSVQGVPSGSSREQLDEELYPLNQAIASANRAVRSQAEGAPYGVDAGKEALEQYTQAIYVSTNPAVSRDVTDPTHMPESWRDVDEAQLKRNELMWTKVVNPYCMGCHRSSTFRHDEYKLFETLAERSPDGRVMLRRYLSGLDNEVAAMPQSEVQFRNLWNDPAALGAIDAWVGDRINAVPVAVIDEDFTVPSGLDFALVSAVGSYDPDGDELSYDFEIVDGAGTGVVLDTIDGEGSEPYRYFEVPIVDVATEIVVRVTVADYRLGEASDEVTITVAPWDAAYHYDATDTPLVIPDASGDGVASTINVSDTFNAAFLQVSVNISHTFIGDLRVTLVPPGGASYTLHDSTGASANDLNETYIIEGELQNAQGDWRLLVQDLATGDTGTLDSWSLDFGVN